MKKKQQNPMGLSVESGTQQNSSQSEQNKETFSIRYNNATKTHQVVNNKSQRVVFESEFLNAANQVREAMEIKQATEGQQIIFVENTPFMVGKLKNERWTICCGTNRIHADFETADEAIKVIQESNINWELICLLTECAVKTLKNNK